MKWHRVSDYCIRSEGYTICKVTVMGKDQYEVWRGKVRIGDWATAEGARSAAAKR